MRNKPIIYLLTWLIIYNAVALLWQCYEIHTIGHINTNWFDTIIDILLSTSVTLNIFLFAEMN